MLSNKCVAEFITELKLNVNIAFGKRTKQSRHIRAFDKIYNSINPIYSLTKFLPRNVYSDVLCINNSKVTMFNVFYH